VFHAVSKPVNRAIDKIINLITKAGKKLWKKIKGNTGKRSKEQKQNHLELALNAASDLIRKRQTREEINSRLPGIRRRFKLKELRLVHEGKRKSEEIVHVHGKVNPAQSGPSGPIPIRNQTQDYGNTLRVTQDDEHEFQSQGNPSREPRPPKRGKSTVIYEPLDSHGRAQGAHARLRRGEFNYENDSSNWAFASQPTNIVGTRTEFPINWDHIPRGYRGGGTFHRGHLLARQLGGKGEDLRNLVPLFARVNTPEMKGYEDDLARRIRTGEHMNYDVKPEYDGTSPIPLKMHLRWKGSRRGSGSVTIDNVP
ncbi:DNA/RNA non-specific endonuclease, partial [Streptomyces sp. NPDC057499]|uniref:DNA/RNA non-specific endonuclease n=1 Tax=Streptomyces sp. NPDC057499 TaxID=3346150 RepID=UPI0036BF4845